MAESIIMGSTDRIFDPANEATWDADWCRHMAGIRLAEAEYEYRTIGLGGYTTYYVGFQGRSYDVVAHSQADAINKVRWRLFGRTPARDLDTFRVISAIEWLQSEAKRFYRLAEEKESANV